MSATPLEAFDRADGECITAEQRAIQRERLLEYLRKHPDGLTLLEAWREVGILSISSRISELKDLGYEIRKARVPVMNRWGERTYVKRYMLSWVRP